MKLKFNWGTGLVIGMVAFISFIMYFVVTMLTDERFKHDMVTEEYYKKELVYQQEIDAEENTNALPQGVTDKKTEGGWLLTFPKNFDPAKINGTVFLYRPSNKQLDFDLPIQLSGQNLLIPDKRLLDGRWNITASWTYDGKKYMYKRAITY
ncbi:MAG: FixH family protein [Salegentibacter sp.]